MEEVVKDEIKLSVQELEKQMENEINEKIKKLQLENALKAKKEEEKAKEEKQ